MSKKNKLKKFSDLTTFPNVFENYDPQNPQLTAANWEVVDFKGKWSEKHFGNNQPLILELACGKGDYTLGLAQRYPDKNFIGVDIKGARIWKGATRALEAKLENVAFLRTRIEQISLFFGPEEVDEIWITFPDPFLKTRKANRRLTSAMFLREYRKILKKAGVLHLKTDSPELYQYSLEVFAKDEKVNIRYQNEDIYAGPLYMDELELKTYYEHMHLRDGRKIKYIQFKI